MDGQLSNQWIDRISKHNAAVPDRANLIICQRHFTIRDFITKHGRWVLKNDAVPSVFGEAAKSAKLLLKLVPSNERSTPYKSTLQTRRYCKIKYCENEVGVDSKEIPFFGWVFNFSNRFVPIEIEWLYRKLLQFLIFFPFLNSRKQFQSISDFIHFQCSIGR